MYRFHELLAVALPLVIGSSVAAQVACGDPNVFAEAIPVVAAPGQPIDVVLTNNSAAPITILEICTFTSVHSKSVLFHS